MSFSALAEQTVDIEIRGIKGERAIRNTDMNVKLIDKGEMDGSDRYKQLVSDAVDKGLRVFGYYGSSVTFELKKRKGQRDLLIANVTPGSLEYQYQVYSNWWGAVFADTGLAANSYTATELRYGAGVGVRWASPVGAIKFDIATPIRDKDNSKNIQFYIGLGAEI
jgi:outer membrane translocation and assembly module TamA